VGPFGNGAAFAKGRDFAAWLGLVPKQMSIGDRTILGRITKMLGDSKSRPTWQSQYVCSLLDVLLPSPYPS
jgi:hypothetical protein